MATIITTDKLAKVADVEFTKKFNENASKLIEMLGQTESIVMQPGTLLKCYQTVGQLTSDSYTEGQDIPLSEFGTKLLWSKEITMKPYRKTTTAQAIQARGYDQAVEETDKKMVSAIQKTIKAELAAALATATTAADQFVPTTTTGANFKAAAANAYGALAAKMEDYGDPEPVYFVNPVDFAAYVGSNDVVSTWGMQYVENFAGLGSMIATTAVASGTIYCTDKQNINVYSINPAGIDGFTFYTDETGLVGVQHETTYRNLSLDTVAVTGFTIFPEIASLVVKATISA